MDISQYLTLPAPQFRRVSGISNERFYRLVAEGQIETFMLGDRRFVVIKSYLALIERQKAAAEKRAAPPPPRQRPAGPRPALAVVEPKN